MKSVLILLVSWSVVAWQGVLPDVTRIERKTWMYLVAAGVVTCISSLLSFRALKMGEASRTSSVERISLVFVIILAAVFLKEKLT